MEPFIQMTNVSKIYGVGDAQVGARKSVEVFPFTAENLLRSSAIPGPGNPR